MRKIKKLLIIILIAIIAFVLLFVVFKVQDIVLKQIYPKKYEELVEKYSKQNNIDPLLTFAIIKAESNFNENVVSSSKAIGLMQLMEPTAEEIANKEGYIEYIVKESLYKPEVNIKIGIKYFSNLVNIYDGNINLALAAYNAGIGNVESWMKQGIIKKDGSDLENIPYKETNNYVRKILRDYEIYKYLYNK